MRLQRLLRRPRSRRQLDLRLGYGAMGLGGGAFVAVLAASLLVQEIVPQIIGSLPEAAAQQIVSTPPIEPVRQRPSRPAPVEPVVVTSPAPTTATGPEQDEAIEPVEPTQPPDPEPTDPPTPQPPVQARDGVTSSLLDPVVTGLTDVVDGATGEALVPVTDAVDGLVDGTTDLVDGLIVGLLGSPPEPPAQRTGR
ncbi:MAG: hypothetical protein F2667_04635 [Actinobacteria bacterium]|nr:hypothetical protein [Actinomycetota bacterium]